MNKTTKQPFSSSPEKGFREAIEEILDKHCSSCWGDKCYYEEEGGGIGEDICCFHQEDQATDQILSLLEGIVPPERPDDGSDNDALECGYNQCRADILEALNGK